MWTMEHPSSIAARSLAALLLALCLVTAQGCCSADRKRTREVLDDVQSERLVFGDAASTVGVMRRSLEGLPEANEVTALGDCAGEEAAARLGLGLAQVSDATATLCAFVVERTAYGPALETLRSFLLSNPGTSGHVWSSDFVVRALLVLRGLPDPTGGRARYDEATVRLALDGP
jgi:hypothetical protein